MSRRIILALCALLLPTTGLSVLAPAAVAAATPAPAELRTSSNNPDDIPVLSWDRVPEATKYDVQVSASSSFATTIWSVTGTVNLNAVPNKQLPSGELWFRVRAVGPAGTSDWATSSFQRQQGAGPTPQTPADGARLVQPTDPVLLTWLPTPGAIRYVVEISSDAGFTEPALIKKYETETTSLVRPDQEAARPYYWRVAGVLASGVTTHWSTTRSYTLLPLPAARLTSPANGTSLPPVDDVVLDWEPVAGAASYDVEVSLVPDFSTTVHTRGKVLGTRYSPPTTLDNNQYYWRVRARDVFGNLQGGDAVDTWEFRRGWSEQPELQHPVGNTTVGDPFTYQWTPVKLASRYRLTVKGDGLPAAGRTCTTTQTSYTPTNKSDCMPIAAGSYTWQVIALDEPMLVQTDPVNAQTGRFSYVPEEPTRLAPSAGAEVSVPTLRWRPVAGAAEYDVVVTNTTTGSKSVDTTTRATSFTPTYRLAAGTYRWFVRTVTEDGRPGATPLPASQSTFRVVNPAPATAATPEPTLAPASYKRFPMLTWTPVAGAAHYKVLVNAEGAPGVTILSQDFEYPAGADTTARFLEPGVYEWRVEAYTSGNGFLGESSTPSRFTIQETARPTGQRLAMTPSDTAAPATSCALTVPDSCRGVGQTPVFAWDDERDTAYYQFYLSYDRELTNLVGKNDRFPVKYPVDVHGTSYTPPEALPEADAGTAFYWGVRACVAENVCRALEYANHSFNKLSQPVTPVAPGIPVAGPEGRSLPELADDITFTWEDYLATNRAASRTDSSLSSPSGTEATSYRIQVASDPQFNQLLDDLVVDQTTFTSYANTYPDTQLYWRVQAVDGTKEPRRPLPWSPRWTFMKKSPVPQPIGPSGAGSPGARFDGSTPLRWAPLPYAAAYEVEIYRNGDTKPDATNLVDKTVVAQSAVSWKKPVAPSATPYTWRVRRVDGGGWRGDWSAWTSYRVSSQPVQLHGPASGTRVEPTSNLFTWAPVPGAATYRWERRAEGSSAVAASADTPATSYAPTATLPDGSWEWRVVALDTQGKSIGESDWSSFSVVGAPQALAAPQVSGTGQVGAMLTSTDPSWDLPGVTNSYQWLRNGSVIAGAASATYEVTSADLGRTLSLRVTGRLPGYRDTVVTSNAVTAVSGPAPTTAAPPRVDGSGQVGTTLTGTPPSWNETGVTMTYQWLRNGVAISRQTGTTYTVTTNDIDTDLTWEVVGTRPGYGEAAVTSNVVRGVLGVGMTNTARPTITGSPAVGTTLRATTGTWQGSPQRYDYQWLRGGAPVAGATSASYRVAAVDAGQQLNVQVTARRTGYADGTAQSDAVDIARISSTTTGSLASAKIKRKARGKVTVVVSASGLGDPLGKVTVKKGAKTLASGTLKAGKGGKVTVTLPKLPKGRHKLKVSYAGEPRVAPSTSKVLKLTVTR